MQYLKAVKSFQQGIIAITFRLRDLCKRACCLPQYSPGVARLTTRSTTDDTYRPPLMSASTRHWCLGRWRIEPMGATIQQLLPRVGLIMSGVVLLTWWATNHRVEPSSGSLVRLESLPTSPLASSE